MVDFQLSRYRDAYFVIRGFRYQIDITILRWMDLVATTHLELECGEDIDVVTRTLALPSSERERQLQQIKRLELRISLRSPIAITAVANAVEHRVSNPDLPLTILFFTNTTPATERPSPFTDRTPGIVAWESIRTGILNDADTQHRLAGIRSLLQRARKPRELNATTWTQFATFCASATDTQLVDLIRCFEWSTGEHDVDATAALVQRRLIESGYSNAPQHAADLHARLFLRVMTLLSQSGRKELHKQGFAEVASFPTLNEHDQSVLTFITSQVFLLTRRLELAEELLEQHDLAIATIQTDLYGRSHGDSTAAALSVQLPYVAFDLPPKVRLICGRAGTVSALLADMKLRTWTALHASIGAGKTQMIVLLAEAAAVRAVHTSLRDLSPDDAALRVCTALKQLTGALLTLPLTDVINRACETLQANSLLILDDLPQLDGSDELSRLLVILATSCRRHGVLMLSASHYPLPAAITERLETGSARSTPIPGFSDADAVDLFRLHGAQSAFCDSSLPKLINAFAEGNGTLLAAYARSLSEAGWAIDQAEMALMTGGQHAQSILDQTIRRLLRTVGDTQTREMLYRLSLIIGHFGSAQVDVIATVPPPIDRPREHLASLTGVWIDQRSQSQMAVSPLVKPLSDTELSSHVRREVLNALGKHVMARAPISVLDVGEASLYYFRSGDFNQLGQLFLFAFSSADALPLKDVEHLFVMSVPQRELPDSMAIRLRLMLRGAHQARVAQRLGKATAPLLDDLDRLIAQAGADEPVGVYGAALLAVRLGKGAPYTRVVRYAELVITGHHQVVHALQTARSAQGIPDTPVPLSAAPFVWLATVGIETAADFSAWLEFLARLDATLLHEALALDLAGGASLMAVDRPWLCEHGKPETARQWQLVLDLYARTAATAAERQWEVIWAAAVRARIIILAEYMHHLDMALTEAVEASQTGWVGSSAKLLVADAIGRELLYKNRPDEALAWLRQSWKPRLMHSPLSGSARLCLRPGQSVTPTPPRPSNSPNGLSSCGSHPTKVAELEMVAALGELGVSLFLAGDAVAAFAPMNESVKRLLACKDSSDLWKQRFVLLIHTVGYVASFVERGRPPEQAVNGNEYAVPTRGSLMIVNQKLAQHYDAQQYDITGIPMLSPILSDFAEAVANDQESVEWAFRGIEAARGVGMLEPVSLLGQHVYPVLLTQGRIAEAIDIAVECWSALTATKVLHEQNKPMLRVGVKVEDILGEKPSANWNMAEMWAMEQGVIPAAMYIARVGLTDRPKAIEYASALITTCREIGEWASNTELWTSVGQCLESIFLDPAPAQTLHDQANAALSRGDAIIHRLCYLGCTLVRDAAVEAAPVYHAMECEYWFRTPAHEKPTYRKIVLPFVEEYWRHTFHQQRFRFSAPSLVETGLTASMREPVPTRAQHILKEVMTGLRVRLPTSAQDAQKWLTGS